MSLLKSGALEKYPLQCRARLMVKEAKILRKAFTIKNLEIEKKRLDEEPDLSAFRSR